ncbi:hypothetical protein E2C01_033813 [Portunus trituberculatus]|uniref:Uncharacterized protein n=1 Tax=Portunus trituberculatus TaxID=210409 RepID=A0A5B7F3X9_PORTR|nr:hypothetical protein [Portunus trituberculatus]
MTRGGAMARDGSLPQLRYTCTAARGGLRGRRPSRDSLEEIMPCSDTRKICHNTKKLLVLQVCDAKLCRKCRGERNLEGEVAVVARRPAGGVVGVKGCFGAAPAYTYSTFSSSTLFHSSPTTALPSLSSLISLSSTHLSPATSSISDSPSHPF